MKNRNGWGLFVLLGLVLAGFTQPENPKGGSLRALITVDGQPRQGASCTVSLRSRLAEQRTLGTATTDSTGTCRLTGLPAGIHLLEVDLGVEKTPLRLAVAVSEGVETKEDLALSRVGVSGKVSRRGKPLPGLTVLFSRIDPQREAVESAEVTTGEDGSYEVTLWEPGGYLAAVAPSSMKPLITDRVVEIADRQTRVDFALGGGVIHGRVVDEEGRPLPLAIIKLQWNDTDKSMLRASSEEGEFEIFVNTEGQGKLTVEKRGYRPSAVHEVKITREAETAAIVVALTRESVPGGPE